MTDLETLSTSLNLLGAPAGPWAALQRNGALLLAIPADRDAALRTISLYQPQRPLARFTLRLIRAAATLRLLPRILPSLEHKAPPMEVNPALPEIDLSSIGVLLGSPEHETRRAISSIKTSSGWEVVKISFGEQGIRNIRREADTLAALGGGAPGIPRLLGFHRAEHSALLRMPFLTGAPIPMGHAQGAISLLTNWISAENFSPADSFEEWPMIHTSISDIAPGHPILAWLRQRMFNPVIRHGDFARWNLIRQSDGSLMVLDWEWAAPRGLPGLDLVHYFLQDARLVARLPDLEAIRRTADLLQHSDCASYLRKTGWCNHPFAMIVASLAFKQGAGHQENRAILKAALEFTSHGRFS